MINWDVSLFTSLFTSFAIANSMLVKTSIFGEEVNWGRIMAALGRCGIEFDPNKVDILYGNIPVVKHGVACRSEEKAQATLKQKEFTIVIYLNRGKKSFQVLTTDLTPQYVEINASYKS
jgi:glutamate N-acetyltransferase/amino-acid N-acetyltransferase